MALIKQTATATFQLTGLTVTGMASPKRGSTQLCVWRIHAAPGTKGTPHMVTHEEVFAALSGRATVVLDGKEVTMDAGDTLVVPPHVMFSLANPHAVPFEAVVSFPVGGQAVTDAGTFTPPWAE